MCGKLDPIYGWSHNLYEVDSVVGEIRLDNRYLNDIDGLDVPSLENIARWLWNQFDNRIPGLNRVAVQRGSEGQREGCSYNGRV